MKKEIQHHQSETKGAFLIEEDGEVKAKLTYSKAGPSLIIIDHTEVSDALRGLNVGKQLVERAVQHAREHELKIIPLCPFTKSVIERHKAMQDVLK